jgi:hypothetical protein
MDSVKVDSATASTEAVLNTIVPPTIVIADDRPTEILSLEQLIRVGKIEEEVNIASFQFKLVTLTSVENADVIAITSNIKEDEQKFSALRFEILSRAVESVNGVALDTLYKGKETLKIKKREEILKLLQQTVINSLWEAYDKMVTKSVEITKLEGTALKN